MNGLKVRKPAVKDVARLVRDQKIRDGVVSGVSAGLAARRRSKRLSGGFASQLAVDRKLRHQLRDMAGHFRKAQQRVEKKRSHGLRNFLLFVTGVGMVAAAFPSVRRLVHGRHSHGAESSGSLDMTSGETTLAEEIEVAVPVRAVYNQWTQFEEFPKFMEGVEAVSQLDDTLLHWAVSVAGKHAEWDAKIIEQEPDRRITWESTDGKRTRGSVTFVPAGPSTTRIRLELSYQAEGLSEKAGAAVGLDKARVRGDLERFRDLIESKGDSADGWRGEIKDGEKTSGG
jgi:uncharacterized membrane protein